MRVNDIPAFVINLDKNPERLVHFKKYKNIKRFPAVYASKIANDENNVMRKELMASIESFTQIRIRKNIRYAHQEIHEYGAVGCSLSHYFLWMTFLTGRRPDTYVEFLKSTNDRDADVELFDDPTPIKESDFLIVIEDDAFLEEHGVTEDDFYKWLQRQWDEMVEAVNVDEWDIWQFSHAMRDTESWDKQRFQSCQNRISPTHGMLGWIMSFRNCTTSFCQCFSFFGTQFYIVKRSCIESMVTTFLPLQFHIDSWMSIFSQTRQMTILYNPKAVVTQRTESMSDIHHNMLIPVKMLVVIVVLAFFCFVIIILCVFLMKRVWDLPGCVENNTLIRL